MMLVYGDELTTNVHVVTFSGVRACALPTRMGDTATRTPQTRLNGSVISSRALAKTRNTLHQAESYFSLHVL
jgi:hypothetical protein